MKDIDFFYTVIQKGEPSVVPTAYEFVPRLISAKHLNIRIKSSKPRKILHILRLFDVEKSREKES